MGRPAPALSLVSIHATAILDSGYKRDGMWVIPVFPDMLYTICALLHSWTHLWGLYQDFCVCVPDCFFRQSHLQFALADYHQALELDPGDENVRSRIAIVHNEHGIAEYMDKNYQVTHSLFVSVSLNLSLLSHSHLWGCKYNV